MTSETSAVLVTVRVRPFNTKEDPATCTITIPDQTTITVVDTPSLMGEANSAGEATTNTNTNSNRDLEKDGPIKHHYTFDRIFWSVPEKVLPFSAGQLYQDKKPITSNAKIMQSLKQYTNHFPCFNQSLPICESQSVVYDFIGPKLTDAVMKGFNACLFAYGQTGSGKSYSMIGQLDGAKGSGHGTGNSTAFTPEASTMTTLTEKSGTGRKISGVSTMKKVNLTEEMGIMPRLANSLFELMQQEREKDEGASFTVEVCFFEIYCEKVRDLLGNMSGGNNANSSTTSLRIRQHPSKGPYVENLSHIKVKSAAHVLQCLLHGLKERATAETLMNEHSSRSHAIMQMHVTKVSIVTEDTGVMTKTRTAKVNMVDLAGSERVSQSGVTGERFEEAKNINLSLSTLGRVIQQLSEKQQGKNVIPAYRESVLTWLLSDSLGGNSKTIMLATVSPSSYCYLQTLNTLRFAGVAKKVINVATVNEDQHFQKLIADLRQQIVRLTLQIEGGKASESHREEIRQLKEEKEELQAENNSLRLKAVKVDNTDMTNVLRKRIEELETSNELLQKEKNSLQQRLLSSTTALREELAQKRAELLKLQDVVTTKDTQLADWAVRYKALDEMHLRATVNNAPPPVTATSTKTSGNAASTTGAASTTSEPPTGDASREEVATLKKKINKLTSEITDVRRNNGELQDQLKNTKDQLEDYKTRYEENKLQLNNLHTRMEKTLGLLETTQCQLAAVKTETGEEAARSAALRDSLINTQLEQVREDYLNEKQSNVQLLLRVSQLEKERSQLKNEALNKQEDMFELEQLLMEETENSERYYLRLRYQRTLTDIQQHLTRRIASTVAEGGNGHNNNGQGSDVSRRDSMCSHQQSPASAFGSPRNFDALSQSMSLMGSPGNFDPLAQSTSHQNTWELMCAQLEYECLCDEAQSRALIEQEYMTSTMRLLAKKSKLKDGELLSTQERYVELLEKTHLFEDEIEYYKKKVGDLEARVSEYEQMYKQTQEIGEQNEVARLRLTRRVRTLEESNAELERNRDTLVERVAELVDSNENLKQRCTEAEALVDEAQNYYFSHPSPTPSEIGRHASGSSAGYNDDGDSRLPSAKMRQAMEESAFALKEKELKAAKDDIVRLQQQCDAYRAEIGTLRAEADRGNSEVIESRDQLRRELDQYEKQKQALEASKQQLSQLMDSTARDYEKRVVQQQDMINTLRKALDEETRMADACRASAQRAEADRLNAEEELLNCKETNDELRRAQRESDAKILKLQHELDDLRVQYNIFEKQLMELKVREPELYLVLEKSANDDNSIWLERARREKANMEKQKLEARRINAELLEHVRRRNSHLRDVQQQIQDISISLTPAVTPINDSITDISALDEFHALMSNRNNTDTSSAGGAQYSQRAISQGNADFGDNLSSIPSSAATSNQTSPSKRKK